jgi:hypothetical protein
MKLMAVIITTIFFGTLWLSAPLRADDLMIYPKEGQSPEQQEKDKFECYSWAKNESGFDPMAPPTATEAPPQQQARQGGVLRGAARGAVVGEIVDDDWETGAKAGAAIGGMRRADQKRKEAQAQQQYEQEQQQIYTDKRNRYNRAYSVCLEARDYAVN